MHIWIHFKEEKKLSNTFCRYSENVTKIIEYLIELWPLPLKHFSCFEGCLLNIFPAKTHKNWFVFRKIGPLSRIVFSMVCRCEISHKIDLRIDIERMVSFLADKHHSKKWKRLKSKGHNSIKYPITFVKFSEYLPNVLLNFFSSLKCI